MKHTRLAVLLVFGMLAALLPAGAVPVAAVSPGDLVVNEIHADPDATIAGDANGDGIRDSSDDEFVEIFNNSGVDIDISGWTLADGFGVRHTFPAGTVVESQCAIVVFGGSTPVGTFGGSLVQTASTGSIGMNNSGDSATLDDGSLVIASASYGSEGGEDQSLTRDPDVTGSSSPFTKHSVATGSGGALFSPGTRIDGSTFSGCSLPALVGLGTADPDVLKAGEATLLTVAVTPGTSPPSTGIAVEADLSAIGGSATQSFFDDGSNGDVISGDNVFSFEATVGGSTALGEKLLLASISDSQGRAGATTIALNVIQTLTIMEIQGSDRFSSHVGEKVETTGVVTLFNASGSSCWLQDPAGDGDPGTSDGIFVSGCGFPASGDRPEIGDFIRIIATVNEQQFGNSLPLTRLTAVDLIDVLAAGTRLPAPRTLADLPKEIMADGEAYWEALEGMLVMVENALVVAATNGFGEFGMLAGTDAKPGSGFYPQTSHVIVQDLGVGTIDYNPERIYVDDSSIDEAIQVRPGDRVRSLVGVVDYTFSMYKLQPASWDIKTQSLPARDALSTRSGGMGDTVITTFNVENLFDLEFNVPVAVDVLGQVGFDPGSEWGAGIVSTQNHTIRRMPTVCNGDPDGSDVFDPSVEWEGFAQDTFDGLGSHTVECGATGDLIISEYVEGSSLNKAIEIFNGTGSAVNLSAESYAVEISFNGGTFVATIPLTGTLADGDVFVLADDGADPAILAVADQTSTSSFFNGDDAVSLIKGGKDDASSTPDPDELETKLSKLVLAVEKELGLPDILVLQEVENQAIAQELGDRVNAAAGTSYVARSFETSDGRGIEVAFLYDEDRVDLNTAFQLSGPDVEAAFGPSSPSPGREPLYGEFQIGDQVVHIVGNHFKSKSGDDPLYGVNWPPVRITEVQRKGQAQVVRDFVDGIFATDPDALVMVAGDLNDFQFSEPGEGPDNPVAIVAGSGGEIPLFNMINLEKEAERWTFVFDGNSQVLDHMLVSPALLEKVAGADVLHFNTPINAVFEDDVMSALAASDHDPLEGRFKLR